MSKTKEELIVGALAQIEVNPSEWNQNAWRCETGMCMAGWIVTINGDEWLTPAGTRQENLLVATDSGYQGYTITLDGKNVDVVEAADRAAWLIDGEITSEDDDLFDPFNTLEDLYTYSANLLGISEYELRQKVARTISTLQEVLV